MQTRSFIHLPNRSDKFLLAAIFAASLASPVLGQTAQTILVDATPTHVVNRFSPPYTLGTTVDRVPSNATDVFLRPTSSSKHLKPVGASLPIVKTPNCSFKLGTGIPKEPGAILPERDISPVIPRLPK